MGALRIMIVENEAIVGLDIRNRLQALGYEVPAIASSGSEASEAAGRLRPDLILMDILLGGDMDGIDAAAFIRENYNIPVVYLTAYADDTTLQRAKITEPFGYIIKPFDDRELSTTIEMALYKHKMDTRLMENQRWLATTLRSIGDAVVTTDGAGLVRFVNPVAEAVLGMPASAVLGRSLGEVLSLVDGGEEDLDGDELARRVLLGGAVKVHRRLLRPGGNGGGSDQPAVLPTIPVDGNCAPIRDDKGQIMGAVLVFRDMTEQRKAEDALRSSVKELRRTLEETVNALAATAEKRDLYTAGHQHRVAQLATAMAREMGLPEERIEGIRVAAVLHDIGKIYIPAEILAKPAVLTSMEMGIMKTHSEVGYDILKRVPFPWPVAEMVLQHHERNDGSGYPRGLTRDQFLPEARIIAVADVVEAMSSHRPYRAALGLDMALEEISSGRGLRYDAEAVDACLALFRERGFGFIKGA